MWGSLGNKRKGVKILFRVSASLGCLSSEKNGCGHSNGTRRSTRERTIWTSGLLFSLPGLVSVPILPFTRVPGSLRALPGAPQEEAARITLLLSIRLDESCYPFHSLASRVRLARFLSERRTAVSPRLDTYRNFSFQFSDYNALSGIIRFFFRGVSRALSVPLAPAPSDISWKIWRSRFFSGRSPKFRL